MAYEKKTGFVELEKLEDASELVRVQGGTKEPYSKWSFCVIRSKVYLKCWDTAPGDVPPER